MRIKGSTMHGIMHSSGLLSEAPSKNRRPFLSKVNRLLHFHLLAYPPNIVIFSASKKGISSSALFFCVPKKLGKNVSYRYVNIRQKLVSGLQWWKNIWIGTKRPREQSLHFKSPTNQYAILQIIKNIFLNVIAKNYKMQQLELYLLAESALRASPARSG